MRFKNDKDENLYQWEVENSAQKLILDAGLYSMHVFRDYLARSMCCGVVLPRGFVDAGGPDGSLCTKCGRDRPRSHWEPLNERRFWAVYAKPLSGDAGVSRKMIDTDGWDGRTSLFGPCKRVEELIPAMLHDMAHRKSHELLEKMRHVAETGFLLVPVSDPTSDEDEAEEDPEIMAMQNFNGLGETILAMERSKKTRGGTN